MSTIYDELFGTYGEAVLKQLNNFPHAEIMELPGMLSISADHQIDLYDRVRQLYLQWSADAFAVGLHLGLSLLYDDRPHLRPEQI